MSADLEIARLDERPNGDRVLVRLREFNRKDYVDVRLFYRGEGGVLAPTQKGVSLEVGEIWCLHDAIGKAIAHISKVRK